MPRRGSPYGWEYQKARAALLGLPCQLRLRCEGAPADSADHDPPLSLHSHVVGSTCCRLRPACRACQNEQGRLLLGGAARRARGIPAPSRQW